MGDRCIPGGRPLETPGHRKEYNIKIDLLEIDREHEVD
jgi:hypothetical protein